MFGNCFQFFVSPPYWSANGTEPKHRNNISDINENMRIDIKDFNSKRHPFHDGNMWYMVVTVFVSTKWLAYSHVSQRFSYQNVSFNLCSIPVPNKTQFNACEHACACASCHIKNAWRSQIGGRDRNCMFPSGVECVLEWCCCQCFSNVWGKSHTLPVCGLPFWRCCYLVSCLSLFLPYIMGWWWQSVTNAWIGACFVGHIQAWRCWSVSWWWLQCWRWNFPCLWWNGLCWCMWYGKQKWIWVAVFHWVLQGELQILNRWTHKVFMVKIEFVNMCWFCWVRVRYAFLLVDLTAIFVHVWYDTTVRWARPRVRK